MVFSFDLKFVDIGYQLCCLTCDLRKVCCKLRGDLGDYVAGKTAGGECGVLHQKEYGVRDLGQLAAGQVCTNQYSLRPGAWLVSGAGAWVPLTAPSYVTARIAQLSLSLCEGRQSSRIYPAPHYWPRYNHLPALTQVGGLLPRLLPPLNRLLHPLHYFLALMRHPRRRPGRRASAPAGGRGFQH